MNNYIIQNGELYHYGVPGMKWGVRRDPRVLSAKQKYKDAKKDLKDTKRRNKISGWVHTDEIDSNQKKLDRIDKSYLDMVRAKAEYNAAKKPGNPERAYKNTYVKEMNKYGMVGSYGDTANRNKSTKLYKDLAKNKGKAYADMAHEKLSQRTTASLVVSSAALVALGAAQVAVYLKNELQ